MEKTISQLINSKGDQFERESTDDNEVAHCVSDLRGVFQETNPPIQRIFFFDKRGQSHTTRQACIEANQTY